MPVQRCAGMPATHAHPPVITQYPAAATHPRHAMQERGPLSSNAACATKGPGSNSDAVEQTSVEVLGKPTEVWPLTPRLVIAVFGCTAINSPLGTTNILIPSTIANANR